MIRCVCLFDNIDDIFYIPYTIRMLHYIYIYIHIWCRHVYTHTIIYIPKLTIYTLYMYTVGGKTSYASIAPDEPLPRDPRLFQCCNLTGAFQVEEVAEFTQADLNDDDVYLLDAYTAVYLWIGNGSNTQERAKADEFVKQYVDAAKDGRDKDCPIIKVNAGAEPMLFTSYFVPWVRLTTIHTTLSIFRAFLVNFSLIFLLFSAYFALIFLGSYLRSRFRRSPRSQSSC